MKKFILPIMLLVLSVFLFSCSLNFEQNDIIPKSDSIEITKHPTSGEGVDQTITVRDTEVVKHITDNLNSLSLEEMDYIKPYTVMYTLVFYDESTEVKQVNIESKKHLSFSDDNNPYAVTKGDLDLDYLDALFTPLSEEETIEQLIINAYKEKYDAKDEVGVDKIYMKLTKDELLVVPYLIDSFADAAFGGETVNGINFHYRDSRRIEVYYAGRSYTLQEAVDKNLLTLENLIDIAKIQNENCKLGHSWNEGELTQVPGGGEDMLYTCLVCGETTNERVNNGNVYSLTLTGAVEYVIEDITGEYAENSLIMISTQTLIDADIEVYVNGMKAEKDKTSNHEGTELFMFSMPSEDAVVEIKVVTSKYFTVTLHDLDDYQWVNELDKNNIIKVKYESSAIGIAPGNLINIVYSTDSEDISKLYDAIILTQYVETDMEYAVMDGGGYRKYEFITDDKTYSVYLSNGFITSQQNHSSADVTELKYYKFLGEHYTFTNPSLECNSFLVYNDTYQVYTTEDDTLIGEYEDLQEFEFAPYEGPLVGWETPYYIETQFGRVYIHTKDIIYLKDGNTFTYFQIVGDKDFSFLFGN